MKPPCKVLFVDDEVEFLQTLIKRMTRRGLSACGVHNGREALETLQCESVDVVVLDVRMPGMNGIETLREIKAGWPGVEVIMLTGHASLEVSREGMELGAFDYLIKPVDLDELLFKVEDALRAVEIQNQRNRKTSNQDQGGRIPRTPTT